MQYHKIFEYFEDKVIIKTGEFYKKTLVSGLSKERTYNHIKNNFRKIISEKKESTIPKLDQELHELLRIFKNRGQYYGSNDTENIFKYDLLENYNKSKIGDIISFKEVVIKFAIIEGLDKADSIILKYPNYFSILYDFDELKSFVFTDDTNKLNALERELIIKYYPENNANINITKMTNDQENNCKSSAKSGLIYTIL